MMLNNKTSRVFTTRLGRHTVQVSRDGRFHALEVFKALGIEETDSIQKLIKDHQLETTRFDFGEGAVPTLRGVQIAKLAFALATPEAKRWRERAAELLGRYFDGDIQLAAEIAERNPEPETRRWLAARLESIESRKKLMSVVAKHGGAGEVYQQVSSLSNQSVLKMNSTELRKKRAVKSTRDGLTALELKRLSYLESVTAKAIEENQAKGNDQILELHRRNAEAERKAWHPSDDKAS